MIRTGTVLDFSDIDLMDDAPRGVVLQAERDMAVVAVSLGFPGDDQWQLTTGDAEACSSADLFNYAETWTIISEGRN